MSHGSAKSDPTPSRRLWTYPETADSLGVSRRTVARLVAEGKLRATKLGRCARIVAASVDEMIERGAAR